MKISKLIVIFLAISVFLISYELLLRFDQGDQFYYKKFYELIYEKTFLEAIILGANNIASSEPASIAIYWIGSNLNIDKNYYFAAINSVFFVSLYILLRDHDVKSHVILLILTNYYLIVMATSAERLKLAYIILILALHFIGKTRITLFVAAPFFHVQILILFFGFLITHILAELNKIIKTLKIKLVTYNRICLLGFIFIIVYLFLGEYIILKSKNYLNLHYADFFKFIILIIVSLLSAKDKKKIIFPLMFLSVFVLFLGGNRVNMIGFTYVFYILLVERRLGHPAFTILLIYHSIKTISFIMNIYEYGDGYGPISNLVIQ